jgi:hypothetical protein
MVPDMANLLRTRNEEVTGVKANYMRITLSDCRTQPPFLASALYHNRLSLVRYANYMLLRYAPRNQDPFTPVRRQRRPTPQVLAGFGKREPYHAFRFLQVNEDNLKPRALIRPREQIRPTAQADERTGEEVLHVQTCKSVHELLPYLVDIGDDSRRLPGLQTEAVQR